MGDDKQTKERIIEAATALIRQHGSAESVTMRDIAAGAGVGVGLINYHFQTKEHLLAVCIQRIISRVIDGFGPMYKALNMPPLKKLRFLAQSTAAFLAAQPGLSRTSIVTDMQTPAAGDNTTQTLSVYLPVIREVCPNAADADIFRKLHTFVSSVQAAFLRKDVLKASGDLDYDHKESRDSFISALVDDLFGGCVQ
jgi:AcrR family transcriptional regulator